MEHKQDGSPIGGADGVAKDDPDYLVGWYDVTLKAHIWFSRHKVTARQAALLLCGHEPYERDVEASIESARHRTSEHVDPESFETVRLALEGADGDPRPLVEWREYAKDRQLSIDPWVDEYLAARKRISAHPWPIETGRAESPDDRRKRRYDRFKALGGELRPAGHHWHVGGKRGALATLAEEERAAGRPMSARTDVKADLVKAHKKQSERPVLPSCGVVNGS